MYRKTITAAAAEQEEQEAIEKLLVGMKSGGAAFLYLVYDSYNK